MNYQAIRYGTEAGIFTTFVASTSKLAKTSYLPLGGKIAVSVGGGIIGLGVFIGDKDFYIISKESVEVLNWDLFIHLGLIILIINVIIFITMKYLSDYDIELNFVKKLPFGNNIYIFLNKLKDLWNKTTIVWIYISLFLILIGTLFSSWFIYDVINKLG